MIGVAVNADDLWAAEEFFELFKTPWEPAVRGRKYAVVLSAGAPIDHLDAEAFLVYGARALSSDAQAGVGVKEVDGPVEVQWDETAFPVYGRLALVDGSGGFLTCTGRAVDCRSHAAGRPVHRVGYDLFQEVRHLLTEGQPAVRAAMPTLDWHIALVRHLLGELGVSFVEIPPRPQGCDFVCCLTHDVDFFGIRRHVFDRTLAGFAVRASLGTLVDLVRGERTFPEALRNWAALFSVPLVFLGLLPDFWRPFDDYANAEPGLPSTFFLVPFKNRPGVGRDGAQQASRGVAYQISEIAVEARAVAARGGELALHGIDAWRDADAGRAEMAELAAINGGRAAGVRMHWLYFDDDAPSRLEEAGFEYDSTCGYNDAVGYRAGTSQVFRPPRTRTLLELPLLIMDSAMFFPGRMGLAGKQAMPLCRQLVAHARRCGGTLVINWHDRSLSPERLWERTYRELLADVGSGDRVWFATAGDAVGWFRWRRSIRFTDESGEVGISASTSRDGLPAAVIAVHASGAGARARSYEMPFEGDTVVRLPR